MKKSKLDFSIQNTEYFICIWEDRMEYTEEFRRQYECPNYRVIDTTSGGGYCYIYFSGNGVFDPDTEDAFRNMIINKDRYEWIRWSTQSERKIYLRDIHKEWYFRGINSVYNTIDKVLSLLKIMSKGYKIVTVGSSAGGYAASLFGILLGAERVFAFSPQFDLTEWLEPRKLLGTKPFVQQERYINIVDIIKESDTEIFYFFPAYVDVDVFQAKLVENIPNVYMFGIKSKLHGKALYPNCIPHVLSADLGSLNRMKKQFQNKIVSPFYFAIANGGIKVAVIGKEYEMAKSIYYPLNDIRRKCKIRRQK